MNTELTDEEVVQGRHDLEFLRRPHLWPGEVCCLKKPGKIGPTFHGFICPGTTDVYLGYVFNEGTGDVLEYSSLEDILADGWVVD